VASTVVLLKALESRRIVESMNGRIAVGWLVVEDLAMVLVLVLLPPLAPMLGGAAAPRGPGPRGLADHARHPGSGRRVSSPSC
jgi:CPA2 family monovalent cation:H+ antiporter-2